MRSESWLRALSGFVLVGVFAAGALFGAAVLRFGGAPRPPPHTPIEAMIHELELDADQIEALHAIAAAHHPQLEAIMRETQPKVRVVLFAIEDELVPRLRPEQRRMLEAWRGRRKAILP